jgi:hypothetical protein
MRARNKEIKAAKEYLEFLKMRSEFANLFGNEAPPYLTDRLPPDNNLLHIFTGTGKTLADMTNNS